MTRWILLVLAVLLPWPAGGFVQDPPKSKAHSDAGRDWSVLELILKDLLTWSDSPLEPTKGAAGQQILLARNERGWVVLIRDFRYSL